MRTFVGLLLSAVAGLLLWRWFEHETHSEGEGTVRLQSEHEHFHLHVDLPTGMEIQPGDTVEILSLPNVQGHTHGEIVFSSPVRLTKASWLRRTLIKRSSLIEVNELVEHP
jgi:hypothetical protein